MKKDKQPSASDASSSDSEDEAKDEDGDEEGGFASKAQAMTLMTTDVDRVGMVPLHIFGLISKLTLTENLPRADVCGADELTRRAGGDRGRDRYTV